MPAYDYALLRRIFSAVFPLIEAIKKKGKDGKSSAKEEIVFFII